MTKNNNNAKDEQLNKVTIGPSDVLSRNTGVGVKDDINSLKSYSRGGTLLEDVFMIEKINHFDHERIPERIVHARGTGARGYFQATKDISHLSKASIFKVGKKTPLFTRISTVQGPRGSTDCCRDVRGFATKFYTDEGNWDLVGNNFPVFFVQDAISFPDFVHAVKMEPNTEMPTAASAHDTLWDFVSLKPETVNTVMWLMSDRAIPISLAHIQGFGVHTYRLINEKGDSTFVKFHWRPVDSGTCSFAWDECQKIAGKDTDYNRRRLHEDIENGDYPTWDLCLQILDDETLKKFDFDHLDPTKIVPEELASLTPIGRMVLDRNPDNFFCETEQVAFCVSHIIPGIDFSNDPLLQGRIFSYLDTQMSRLGGPNFNELPINKPVCPFSNNQRDGMHRHTINNTKANYFPNSIDDGKPKEDPKGFVSFPEKVEGLKARVRSETFNDHFSQATQFWNSMAEYEKRHIVSAFTFELSKVGRKYIRERVVNEILANIDDTLCDQVAKGLGIKPQKKKHAQKIPQKPSPALSQSNLLPNNIRARRVAILVDEHDSSVSDKNIKAFAQLLANEKARSKVISSSLASFKSIEGTEIVPDEPMVGSPSIFFDAVYVPSASQELLNNGDAVHYILEAYKHCKVIAFTGPSAATAALLKHLKLKSDAGIITGETPADVFDNFKLSLKNHRIWDREKDIQSIPA
ncbi:hypothetical protein CYY_005110 [Polysphondylium violaceum]|uniref:Catalase n=1 Tax=Polysphondylium violaceum TaxID=133409 RepID=A0A8J4PSB2_9MYCE|nr:hypothetical protein CYY_005110 [Polysphondylium violaceum]